MESDPFITPHTVVVRGLNAQGVVARAQVRVLRLASRASKHPSLVETIHQVGILVLVWHGVIKGRKLEVEEIVVVG